MLKVQVVSSFNSQSPQFRLTEVSGGNLACVWSAAGDLKADFEQQFLQEFEHHSFSSSADVHQVLSSLSQKAKEMSIHFQFVAATGLEEKVVFCAQGGQVILCRLGKVSRLVVAEEELKIIEGSHRKDNLFTLILGDVPEAISTLEQYISKQPVATELIGAFQSTEKSEQIGVSVVHFLDQHEEVMQSLGGFVSPKRSPGSGMALFWAKKKQEFIKLSRSIFGKILGKINHDVYVERQPRSRLLLKLVPIVLVVALVLGLWFFWQNKLRAEDRLAQELLTPIQSELAQVRQTAQNQPLQARQKTEELIASLETLVQQNQDKGRVKNALAKELDVLRTYYTEISGQQELPDLPQFFNLSLAESTFMANQMDLFDEMLLFLDSGKKKVIALNIANKQYTVLPLGDIAQIRDAVLNKTQVYLLGEGIARFNLGKTEAATSVKAADDINKVATQLALFGQNIYVLGKEKRNIFRYSVGDGGQLSDPVGWVKSGQKINFDQVQSFSIDGDIWLTTTEGKIHKMSTGDEQNFTITGLKDEFSSPITLYTKEDLANLYVLEPAKERVVVLKKNGEFVREIKSKVLASTIGLVAQEKLGKLFVMSGQSVYQIEL